MTATIDAKANELVIRLPLGKPRPSSTGKTLVVATTGGFSATDAELDGRRVSVNVTATVKP